MTSQRSKETKRFSHRCLVLFSTPRTFAFSCPVTRSAHQPLRVYVTGDSHSYINCIVIRHLPRESPRAINIRPTASKSSTELGYLRRFLEIGRRPEQPHAVECCRYGERRLRPNDHRSAHVESPQRCLRDRAGHLSSVRTSLARDWSLFHNDLRPSRKLIPIQVSMTPSRCKHSFPSVSGLARIDWDDSILALASPEIEIIAFSVTFGVYPT